MRKGTAILLGVLGVAMAGTAAASLTYALNADFRAKVDETITGKKADAAIDWAKIDVDENFTIYSKDTTAKTAKISYVADTAEYVKAPLTVDIGGGVFYTVKGVTFSQAGFSNDYGISNPYVRSCYLAGLPADLVFSFGWCQGLKSAVLPIGLSTLPDNAFIGCESLISIDLPESVSSIGLETFRGCRSLRSVSFPSGLTHISEFAFSDCVSLEKADLPEGLTTLATGCFSGCTSLSELTVPSSLTHLDELVFYGCTSLRFASFPAGTSIFYDGDLWGIAPESTVLVKSSKPTITGRAIGYQTYVYFDAYKADVTWATLATERTGEDKRVYYKGEWALKDGKPVLTGEDAEVASTASSSSAA